MTPALAVPNRDSPEYARLLRDAQLRKLTKARKHPTYFYEYVMREETTRARIQTLAFQRLVFDFMMDNPQCVIRLPVGGSKTYMMTAATLYFLGEDPTARGAIISATQGQAAKPLALVRDYIDQSYELHAVYPKLRQSQREGDPWTQTAITVDRPFGIRDPSLVAVGVDGNLPGSRLSWILVDDILSMENTNTPEQRTHVRRWFGTTVQSRQDFKGSRLVVTNTPWVAPTSSDPGDLTYMLEAEGWPTLTINVWGGVKITNAPQFDSDLIRPANDCDGPDGWHRLVAHDDPEILVLAYGEDLAPNPIKDEDEYVSFWPQRFTHEVIADKRAKSTARDFAQNYEMKARAESEDRIKEEWIQQSKNDARRLGYLGFCSSITDLRRYDSAVNQEAYDRDPERAGLNIPTDLIVCTGVDLAIGKKKTAAQTVLFTACVLPPDNKRLILDIEAGRFTGREIVLKIIAKHEAYGSIVRVENNTAQEFLLQWTRDQDKSVPIRAHTTGRNKADPTHGVESMFIEIEQGAWLMPCNHQGKSPKPLEAWLQDLRQYEQGKHTGDFLMSSWFCDMQMKKQGANIKGNRQPQSLASVHYR